MSIKVIQDGYCTIVKPIGSIDAISAKGLQAEMERVYQKDFKHLVFDMEEVPFVSSAGLRVFIKAAKAAAAGDIGRVAVCGLNSVVHQVFELAGFEKIMALCDDIDQAKVAV